MLGICEPRNVEKRLIINVGIAVSGVMRGSPALDPIDRVTDVRAGSNGRADNV